MATEESYDKNNEYRQTQINSDFQDALSEMPTIQTSNFFKYDSPVSGSPNSLSLVQERKGKFTFNNPIHTKEFNLKERNATSPIRRTP